MQWDFVLIFVFHNLFCIFAFQLTDLGCSKPIDLRTIESNLISKMPYIAPELITSEKHSCSVDYWSIGMVMYEVITGSRPFLPHLMLAQWILRVREKKSEHITIYEDESGEFIYSNQIYGENQLSIGLSQLLCDWFKLAFEWNGKQRGCVFEKNDSNQPPVKKLKFFQCIDEMLEKKLLTIFVLKTRKYLSFDVKDNTSNDELIAFIEREAKIPKEKCQFIIWSKNRSTEQFNKPRPIDLYVDGSFDKPMVFVAQIDGIELISDDKSTENVPDAINLPISVRNVLTNPEKRLKIHTLWKFARDTVYFVRNENSIHKMCLNGWFKFAQQLNHEIEMCQQNVREMQVLIYGALGALELYKQSLNILHEKRDECTTSWMEQHTRIVQNIERLVNACDKITIRYGSINRRIREVSQTELLSKRCSQDFYDIINVTKAYELLRTQMFNSNALPKAHFELFQCAFKCLKQRESLLKNKMFIETQR